MVTHGMTFVGWSPSSSYSNKSHDNWSSSVGYNQFSSCNDQHNPCKKAGPLKVFYSLGEVNIWENNSFKGGTGNLQHRGSMTAAPGTFFLSFYVLNTPVMFYHCVPWKVFFVLMNLNFNKIFKTHIYLLLKIKIAYETFFIASQSFENQKTELICPVLITLNLSHPMFKISPVILITCKKGYVILRYLLTVYSRHSIYYNTKSSYIMYFLLYINIKSINNLLYSR